MIKKENDTHKYPSRLEGYLGGSFLWKNTKEGGTYWALASSNLERMNIKTSDGASTTDSSGLKQKKV